MPYAANLEKLALPTCRRCRRGGKVRVLPELIMKQADHARPGSSGGCHCGAVRFEVHAPDEVELIDCNCSMCTKTGYLHLIVSRSTIFACCRASRRSRTYTFNTGVAKHYFCSMCGIKSFYVPRSHPDGYSVNFRCLDDRQTFKSVITTEFDGSNWEDNADEACASGEPLMSTQILMPALSPTMEEGKLAKWLVKEGDTVKSGDILAEIETDKATMEFEAVDEGRIGKLARPRRHRRRQGQRTHRHAAGGRREARHRFGHAVDQVSPSIPKPAQAPPSAAPKPASSEAGTATARRRLPRCPTRL